MVDKNNAMVEFLQSCPYIANNPLFFNFGTIKDGANQISTRSTDINIRSPYIDGSVLKRYTFNIDTFKSATYNPVVSGRSDENVEDLAEIQTIIDWIREQEDSKNYPDFGVYCVIDEMKSLTEQPQVLGVDVTLNPPMAIYRISIQIDYLDTEHKLWT